MHFFKLEFIIPLFAKEVNGVVDDLCPHSVDGAWTGGANWEANMHFWRQDNEGRDLAGDDVLKVTLWGTRARDDAPVRPLDIVAHA